MLRPKDRLPKPVQQYVHVCATQAAAWTATLISFLRNVSGSRLDVLWVCSIYRDGLLYVVLGGGLRRSELHVTAAALKQSGSASSVDFLRST